MERKGTQIPLERLETYAWTSRCGAYYVRSSAFIMIDLQLKSKNYYPRIARSLSNHFGLSCNNLKFQTYACQFCQFRPL